MRNDDIETLNNIIQTNIKVISIFIIKDHSFPTSSAYLHLQLLVAFQKLMQLTLQLQLALTLPVIGRIVPKQQLLLQLFVAVIFSFVQFEVPKLSEEAIYVLHLLSFFRVFLKEHLVRASYPLQS